MDKRALLSSTAAIAPPEPDRFVRSGDLYSGRHYTIVTPSETPHTITFEDLHEMLERADKQHAERRYLTPAEQRDIWENRFRPIPKWQPDRTQEMQFFRSTYLSTFGHEPRDYETRLFGQLLNDDLTTRRK